MGPPPREALPRSTKHHFRRNHNRSTLLRCYPERHLYPGPRSNSRSLRLASFPDSPSRHVRRPARSPSLPRHRRPRHQHLRTNVRCPSRPLALQLHGLLLLLRSLQPRHPIRGTGRLLEQNHRSGIGSAHRRQHLAPWDVAYRCQRDDGDEDVLPGILRRAHDPHPRPSPHQLGDRPERNCSFRQHHLDGSDLLR